MSESVHSVLVRLLHEYRALNPHDPPEGYECVFEVAPAFFDAVRNELMLPEDVNNFRVLGCPIVASATLPPQRVYLHNRKVEP